MTVVAGDTGQAAPQLSASGLVVEFGPVTALDGVSLDLRAGETVVLAGENGAGKTTLVRCIAGDITPDAGVIALDGQPMPPGPVAAKRKNISVVWQDLALCDNLDVASNVMLGRERRRHLMSETRMHAEAAGLFERLGVPLKDTTRSVRSLSGGQRQLVAVARAMAGNPRLLLLDEPTAALGVQAAGLVEDLILRLRGQGTSILFSCHDVDQMLRLADRIVVLRQGKVIGELIPSEVHPDEVVALISGQELDSSPRRQLSRLHGLADRLVSSDPSSSLSLILSALGVALGSERLCIHLLEGDSLSCAVSLGLTPGLQAAWARLPLGPAGGPAGLTAQTGRPVIEENVAAGPAWAQFTAAARLAKVVSSWSVPVQGPGGLLGVITVLRAMPGRPGVDHLDLATLYAGYAASAIERDRLLDQVTARNRTLETIREVLETLAGPVPVADGLAIALASLRRGLEAAEVALVVQQPDGPPSCRAHAAASPTNQTSPTSQTSPVRPTSPASPTSQTSQTSPTSPTSPVRPTSPASTTSQASPASPARPTSPASLTSPASPARPARPARPTSPARPARPGRGPDAQPDQKGASPAVLAAAAAALTITGPDGAAVEDLLPGGVRVLSVTFAAPGGRTCLVARWDSALPSADGRALLEDAAHSLRLALEREEAGIAHQEAMTLRRSQELQRGFLRRLSHELRTPLTAIRGYASSLLQPDVTWDPESQQRFLSRIAAESSRLGRLVDDLLDFSAIESGILRLQCDWCDIPLVLDAAVAVLPPASAPLIEVDCQPGLPVVWADHDRLEQVFVNLLNNALGHNPPGTRVRVSAQVSEPATVTVTVADDGDGMPPEFVAAPFEPVRRQRTASTGAGLGLSIASGIVAAHGGQIELAPAQQGTCFRIYLPVERPPGGVKAPGTPRIGAAPGV